MHKLYFLLILFIVFPIKAQSIDKAVELLSEKKYSESLDVLDELIEKNPEYVIAYNYRGYIYMLQNKPQEALDNYSKSNELSPSSTSLLGKQWALLYLGRYEESLQDGEKVLAKDPSNYYAKVYMADAYYGLKEYEKAQKLYEAQSKINPQEADLVWKIGLCEYYRGNSETAKTLFEKGHSLNPNHEGINHSLENMNNSFVEINPYGSHYSFKGSDYIGSGNRYGLDIRYFLNEWKLTLGVSTDTTQNLNSTKGVNNYIFSDINLIQYSQFQNSNQFFNYLHLPLNLYYLNNLLSSNDYKTNYYKLGISNRINEKTYIFASIHNLQTNTSFSNGAVLGSVGLSYVDKWTFTGSFSSYSMSGNNGNQLKISAYTDFGKYFYSLSEAFGEISRIKTYEIHILTSNPVSTYTNYYRENRTYAYISQELGFFRDNFSLGIGGRAGNARTPLMDENWLYNNFDLLSGGYGVLGFYWNDWQMKLVASKDHWNEYNGNRSTSNTYKFSLNGRF